MPQKRVSSAPSQTKSYRTFESNLHMLAYFLGTTERWYDKQVRELGKQVREASKQLTEVEIEMEKLSAKSKLSKAESKQFKHLMERADDLTDTDIFVPMDLKLFRQFSELIRVLSLSYVLTVFEGYLVDIVREMLLSCPDALKSARQLSAATVLGLGERKHIVQYLAEKEVDELLYRSFPDVVRYFETKFNIDLSDSQVSIGDIVEVIEARNIHVHNKGMVNQRYLERVKGTTLRLGAYRPITRKYLADSIASIRSLAKFVDAAVETKYFTG